MLVSMGVEHEFACWRDWELSWEKAVGNGESGVGCGVRQVVEGVGVWTLAVIQIVGSHGHIRLRPCQPASPI